MVEEKELHKILDKMEIYATKLYEVRNSEDDEALKDFYTRELDDLREEFGRKLASCSREFQYLFLTGTLKKQWKNLKRETLCIRAILLDELARF